LVFIMQSVIRETYPLNSGLLWNADIFNKFQVLCTSYCFMLIWTLYFSDLS